MAKATPLPTEVTLADETDADLFLVEVATYPEERVPEQLVRDLALVFLDRGLLPEVLTLVLRPRGNQRVPDSAELHSRRDWSRLQVGWRVVELWTVPAEQLLAANDVGLIPWVPLAQSADPPETVLHECRHHIDEQAPPNEHANLLAVTQVLTGLRYNDPGLLKLIGGRRAMIESPVLQEFLQEAVVERGRKDILQFLAARFGPVPQEIVSALQRIEAESHLEELINCAATCPDLDAFRTKLNS